MLKAPSSGTTYLLKSWPTPYCGQSGGIGARTGACATPIFEAIGIIRYFTKPLHVTVRIPTTSIFTYSQGVLLTNAQAMEELMSAEVRLAYTSVDTEHQLREKLRQNTFF